MKEIICVLAISNKKEMGWIKVSTPFKDSWGEIGMHFDRKFSAIFVAPGLYEVEIINNAGFGGNPAYQVTNAKKIGTFSELIDLVK